MALIVTGAGGVCLLVGLLLLGRMAGSYDVDAVLAARDAIQSDTAYLPALILILIGAFTKSAQFPFHFWLPHAMAADAGVGLSALGDDGEGGHFPATPALPRPRRHRQLVSDRDRTEEGRVG